MRSLRAQVPTQDHAVSSHDTRQLSTPSAYRATVQRSLDAPTNSPLSHSSYRNAQREAVTVMRSFNTEWRPYCSHQPLAPSGSSLTRTKGMGASWASTAPGDVDLELPYGHWLVTTTRPTPLGQGTAPAHFHRNRDVSSQRSSWQARRRHTHRRMLDGRRPDTERNTAPAHSMRQPRPARFTGVSPTT